jgi:hypothetical protein
MDLIENDDKNETQKEQFSIALLQIKKDVTKEDRINCAKEVNRSKRTINEYVNGHVYDVDIAVKVLKFLKSKIVKRADALK